MRQRFIYEQVAGRASQHLEYLDIGQAFVAQALDQTFASPLRGHADAMVQVISLTHQPSPSSQPWTWSKASLKVRSSCSGVTDT